MLYLISMFYQRPKSIFILDKPNKIFSISKNKGFVRCKVNKSKTRLRKIILMQKIEHCLKNNICPYVIIYKKRKSPIIMVSNWWQLSWYYGGFGEMAKYPITKLKKDMRNIYKILTHS